MTYYNFWKKRFVSILTIFIVLIQVATSCGGGEKKEKETDKEVKNEKLPSDTQEEIAKLIESATEKFGKSDFEGALKDYDKILGLDPKNATIYGNRGNIKNNLGDVKGAIADTKKAIELEPDNAVHYQTMAYIHYAQQKYAKTLEFANQAIEKQPEYAAAYFTRGTAYLEMKQADKACADFKQAGTLGYQPFADEAIAQYCK